jgi:hypothetical protein
MAVSSIRRDAVVTEWLLSAAGTWRLQASSVHEHLTETFRRADCLHPAAARHHHTSVPPGANRG